MKHQIFRILIVTFSLLSSFVSTAAATKQEINIGVIGNFSVADIDTAEPYDNYTLNGILTAVNQYNDTKEGKYHINIIKFDHKGDMSRSLSVASNAANSNIVASIGYLRSAFAISSASKFQNANLPLIVVLASHDGILKLGDSIFKICYTDSNQILSQLNFLHKETTIKRIAAVITEDNVHGANYVRTFKKLAKPYKIEIVKEYSVLENDEDFNFLKGIKKLQYDAILSPNGTYITSALIKQMNRYGIDKPLIGDDSWGTDARIYALTDGVKFNAYQSIHWSTRTQTKGNAVFTEYYSSKFTREPLSSSACAYDAALLLINAVDTVDGNISRKAIKNKLLKIDSSEGITGKWHYDKKRNFVKKALIIHLDGKDYKVLGEY